MGKRLKAKKIMRGICAGILALMLAVPAFAGSVFPDVDDNAAYAGAVAILKEYEIFQGNEKGLFLPDSGITRAEFTAVLCRMLCGETDALNSPDAAFSDVPASHWATHYISWATESGIINGYGNGRFGPSDPVTYEQAIKMVVCAIELEERAQEAGGWPNGYIQAAKDNGMLTNVEGSVGMPMTRANVAVLLVNSNPLA